MLPFRRLIHLPLRIKAPLLVALLMATAGAVASHFVLSRLATMQRDTSRAIAGVWVDGLAVKLGPPLLRGDPWEAFDALDGARTVTEAFRPNFIVALDAGGRVIAASDPPRAPALAPAPSALLAAFPAGDAIVVDAEAGVARLRRTVAPQGVRVGVLLAEIDVSAQLAERRELLRALILTNAGLTLALSAAGFVIVGRAFRPLGLIAEHLEMGAEGRAVEIPADRLGGPRTEFGRLARRFNAMARAVNERESLAARLAEEERAASLGRLASGMAHEINNPLGGLFNAVSTLRRHGADPAVRARSLSLIERGLQGIRDVVRATLTVHRPERGGRSFGPSDLADLRVLVEPATRRRALTVVWRAEAFETAAPAGPVRQAALNLLLNASEAAAAGGAVRLTVHDGPDGVALTVEDDGPGLSPELVAYLEGESAAPPRSGGLGLWVVARAAQTAGFAVRAGTSDLGGAAVTLLLAPAQERRDVA